MLDFSEVDMSALAVHSVGNKVREENLKISKGKLEIEDLHTQQLVLKYFLSPFDGIEFFNLSHPDGLEQNQVFSFAKKIFSNEAEFYIQSIELAKHLYESTVHPKIKAGELYVCLLRACSLDGAAVDAIGLFKSENKETFLKIDGQNDNYTIDHEDGININKLDKGCIIFNVEEEQGYKVCIVDSHGRSEGQSWKEDFLKVKSCNDNYHHTQNFLTLTKDFVTGRLGEEFQVTKADQANYLNRSVDYFKKKEQFDENEFATVIFDDKNVINSFRKYKEDFQQEKDFELTDDFSISSDAVKSQSRVFKSVIKLDKNFHIYIHGNKNLIEQGYDEVTGKKFYKIFFDKEL
jgi:hypothetical protein